jgi:hypothetical protein
MADKQTDAPVPSRVVFSMAYLEAWKELNKLVEDEKQIAVRKAQLRDTMKALAPLVSPEGFPVDIAAMSLANAIRLVIRSAGRPVNALEIRSRLNDLGYNLGQHENPMASIHTALRRMEENDEVKPSEWDGEDKKKKFEPGPELKAPQDTGKSEWDAAVAGLAGLDISGVQVKNALADRAGFKAEVKTIGQRMAEAGSEKE